MARVAKIDNVIKKRFEREEKKRQVEIKDERVYFLIVCEGEKTEPNYFKELEKELPIGTVKLEIDGTGRNTISLIDYTIKQATKARYDRVWAVFDKDDFVDKDFNGAIIKATQNDINCAWTNEAFELWFLLHFQFVNTAMKRDDYKLFLEREIKDKTGNKSYVYRKNASDTYWYLNNHGNQTQAILWAKRLRGNFADMKHANHNPCTCVHELILELYNPKDVLEKIRSKEVTQ